MQYTIKVENKADAAEQQDSAVVKREHEFVVNEENPLAAFDAIKEYVREGDDISILRGFGYGFDDNYWSTLEYREILAGKAELFEDGTLGYSWKRLLQDGYDGVPFADYKGHREV